MPTPLAVPESKPVVSPILSLLRSRKFLVLLLDVVLQIFGEGFGLGADLLAYINQGALMLIGAIAAEDVAAKLKK